MTFPPFPESPTTQPATGTSVSVSASPGGLTAPAAPPPPPPPPPSGGNTDPDLVDFFNQYQSGDTDDEDRAPQQRTAYNPATGQQEWQQYDPATGEWVFTGVPSSRPSSPSTSEGPRVPAGLPTRETLLSAGGQETFPGGDIIVTLPDGRVQRFYQDTYTPGFYHGTSPTGGSSSGSSRTFALPQRSTGNIRYETNILGASEGGGLTTPQVTVGDFIRFELEGAGMTPSGDIEQDALIATRLATASHDTNESIIRALGGTPSGDPIKDAASAAFLQSMHQRNQAEGMSPAESAEVMRFRAGAAIDPRTGARAPDLSFDFGVRAPDYPYDPRIASEQESAFRESGFSPGATDYFMSRVAAGDYVVPNSFTGDPNDVVDLRPVIKDVPQQQRYYYEPGVGERPLPGFAEGGQVNVGGGDADAIRAAIQQLYDEYGWIGRLRPIRGVNVPEGAPRWLVDRLVALNEQLRDIERGGGGGSGAASAMSRWIAEQAAIRARDQYKRELAGLPALTPFALPYGVDPKSVNLPFGTYASPPDPAFTERSLQERVFTAADPLARADAQLALSQFRSSVGGASPGRSRDDDDEPQGFRHGGTMMAPEEIVGVGRFTHKPYFRLAEGMPYSGRPEKLTITPIEGDIKLGRERAA